MWHAKLSPRSATTINRRLRLNGRNLICAELCLPPCAMSRARPESCHPSNIEHISWHLTATCIRRWCIFTAKQALSCGRHGQLLTLLTIVLSSILASARPALFSESTSWTTESARKRALSYMLTTAADLVSERLARGLTPSCVR